MKLSAQKFSGRFSLLAKAYRVTRNVYKRAYRHYIFNRFRLMLLRYSMSRNLLAWIGLKYASKKQMNFKAITNLPPILTPAKLGNEKCIGETLHEEDFIDEYADYCTHGGYAGNYYEGHASKDNAFGKKTLEHLLSLKLALGNDWKKANVTILDVGAAAPVFRNAAMKSNPNLEIYCVDVLFAPGIHGYLVGIDGSVIPFSDNSIDVIVLHCAYEHFEGQTDVDFLAEATRLLKPGGKVVIVPFYLTEESVEITDPFDCFFDTVFRKRPVQFSKRMKMAMLQNFGHRFVRFYAWDDFNRLLQQFPMLSPDLHYIQAANIILNPAYIQTVRWALTLTKTS